MNFKNKLKHLYYRASGHPVEYDLKEYQHTLNKINRFNFNRLSNPELKAKAISIKNRIEQAADPQVLIPELFSLIRTISEKKLGLRHYDVQLMAGIALNQGKIVEMETGEGKTLAAVLPACFQALNHKGVHILTANDYLAARDALWMEPVYKYFGLSVSYIKQGMRPDERRKAYQSDITYLTAKEAGFDFLRDQIAIKKKDLIQREFNFCIVDEADFILIDEARVPLVIAGSTEEAAIDLTQIQKVIKAMAPDRDFTVEPDQRNASFTETGIKTIEKKLGISNIFASAQTKILSAFNLALHARTLLIRDRDYIVTRGKVEIVDEFTGRIADNRRWPHGIHTAVEIKEGITPRPEGNILNSITIQHFLGLYPRIAGMTATAESAASEFFSFYNLKIVIMPPNKKCIRVDEPDNVYATSLAKQEAVIAEIKKVNKTGQPVLVGTASVKESESLADKLKQENISCMVLNAKNDQKEAGIIARAGCLGRVTISTNMAGRGTDIHLGAGSEDEHNQVAELGGLYVIGTNRHESRRIDNQLRGRSGRQGDPGRSKFFISMEDDFIQRYNVEHLIPRSVWGESGQPSENPLVHKEIARAQRIIEGQNFEIRQTLWNYSELIEKQRKLLHNARKEILEGKINAYSLENLVPEICDTWAEKMGNLEIRRISRSVSLYYLDRYWSNHLEAVNEIREGIHLVRYAGVQPLNEYKIRIGDRFIKMDQKIVAGIIKTVKKLKVENGKIDLKKQGLKLPSSTWTYLINDNPFSTFGLDLIASRNLGFSSFGGLIVIMYLPLILLIKILKKIKTRLNKKIKSL